MTLDPFSTALPVIQFHIIAAGVGLAVGPFALFRRRRDWLHKRLGAVWIAAMVALAMSGLFIHSEMAVVWHFGPIHLFSVFTLWGLAEGIWHIRQGQIAKHRASMQSVWFGAMGLAGLFTFLPGRTLNRMVFGGPSDVGWVVISAGLVLLVLGWRRWIAVHARGG